MITHSFGACVLLFWMVGNVLFFLFTDLAQREYDRQMLHFESLAEFESFDWGKFLKLRVGGWFIPMIVIEGSTNRLDLKTPLAKIEQSQ